MRKLTMAILAIIIVPLSLAACTNNDAAGSTTSTTQETAMSYNGTWKDDIFEAEIADDSIVINIVSDDTKSLYWKGTFPVKQGDVTSAADTEALSASIMGSQDAEKVFDVDDETISFEMSMMGTTKTVHLKR